MDADNVTNRLIKFYREKYHDNKCIQVANHREIYIFINQFRILRSHTPRVSCSLLFTAVVGLLLQRTQHLQFTTVRHDHVR